jgi:hypothetical protein
MELPIKTIHFSEINGSIQKNSVKWKSITTWDNEVLQTKEDSEGNIWFQDRDTGALDMRRQDCNKSIPTKLSTQRFVHIKTTNKMEPQLNSKTFIATTNVRKYERIRHGFFLHQFR